MRCLPPASHIAPWTPSAPIMANIPHHQSQIDARERRRGDEAPVPSSPARKRAALSCRFLTQLKECHLLAPSAHHAVFPRRLAAIGHRGRRRRSSFPKHFLHLLSCSFARFALLGLRLHSLPLSSVSILSPRFCTPLLYDARRSIPICWRFHHRLSSPSRNRQRVHCNQPQPQSLGRDLPPPSAGHDTGADSPFRNAMFLSFAPVRMKAQHASASATRQWHGNDNATA